MTVFAYREETRPFKGTSTLSISANFDPFEVFRAFWTLLKELYWLMLYLYHLLTGFSPQR
ncbi:hypothetical protein [Gluconobacter sp. P5H9_a]|uniref:hypothetical protein n=1 Tax=Gluconobacter sp. P5H9_a TaxID=2762616 RepID=UPI001C052552|nr:hypothetical protein [Gluconobacter sp. P5H9_a]